MVPVNGTHAVFGGERMEGCRPPPPPAVAPPPLTRLDTVAHASEAQGMSWSWEDVCTQHTAIRVCMQQQNAVVGLYTECRCNLTGSAGHTGPLGWRQRRRCCCGRLERPGMFTMLGHGMDTGTARTTMRQACPADCAPYVGRLVLGVKRTCRLVLTRAACTHACMHARVHSNGWCLGVVYATSKLQSDCTMQKNGRPSAPA